MGILHSPTLSVKERQPRRTAGSHDSPPRLPGEGNTSCIKSVPRRPARERHILSAADTSCCLLDGAGDRMIPFRCGDSACCQ